MNVHNGNNCQCFCRLAGYLSTPILSDCNQKTTLKDHSAFSKTFEGHNFKLIHAHLSHSGMQGMFFWNCKSTESEPVLCLLILSVFIWTWCKVFTRSRELLGREHLCHVRKQSSYQRRTAGAFERMLGSLRARGSSSTSWDKACASEQGRWSK